MDARLILIDGLPASGKSTLATALATRLPDAHVYLENRGENPLHAFKAEEDVAEFADIYGHTPEGVRDLSLNAWHRFVGSALPGTHIAESYPFQSGVRLLLQIDAGAELVEGYVSSLARITEPLAPRLVYLRTGSSDGDFTQLATVRGPEWFASVCAFFERSTWARNRSLVGESAALAFMGEYVATVENLLASLTIPRLELPGGKDLDSLTVERVLAWI